MPVHNISFYLFGRLILSVHRIKLHMQCSGHGVMFSQHITALNATKHIPNFLEGNSSNTTTSQLLSFYGAIIEDNLH